MVTSYPPKAMYSSCFETEVVLDNMKERGKSKDIYHIITSTGWDVPIRGSAVFTVLRLRSTSRREVRSRLCP